VADPRVPDPRAPDCGVSVTFSPSRPMMCRRAGAARVIPLFQQQPFFPHLSSREGVRSGARPHNSRALWALPISVSAQ
jgi:hypothetical protein